MKQNVDIEELSKFTPLAAHWWDPNGELKTLHQMNPLRLGYIEEKIGLNGKKVLDIGCGGGILSESMHEKGATVTGIDMNQALIDVAKLHQLESHTQVNYRAISVEHLAEETPGEYDVITCLELLEHVPDPSSIIKASAKLVKPGGYLFFSTLNRTPKAYLFAILGAEYILKLLPKNTHDYAKFIKPSELNTWLRNAGLESKEIQGMAYQPFSEEFSLTDDISINYLVYARKE